MFFYWINNVINLTLYISWWTLDTWHFFVNWYLCAFFLYTKHLHIANICNRPWILMLKVEHNKRQWYAVWTSIIFRNWKEYELICRNSSLLYVCHMNMLNLFIWSLLKLIHLLLWSISKGSLFHLTLHFIFMRVLSSKSFSFGGT